jgi:hypothetical protein
MRANGEESPHTEDAARAADHEEHREEMKPGDEAPPGDQLAGENICRVCRGSGELDGRPCANCAGTGMTTSIISGGP